MVPPIRPWGRDMLTVHLSTKAYHVSSSKYNIVTVDRGVDATVKVWTARRLSSNHQGRVSDIFGW